MEDDDVVDGYSWLKKAISICEMIKLFWVNVTGNVGLVNGQKGRYLWIPKTCTRTQSKRDGPSRLQGRRSWKRERERSAGCLAAWEGASANTLLYQTYNGYSTATPGYFGYQLVLNAPAVAVTPNYHLLPLPCGWAKIDWLFCVKDKHLIRSL